MGLLRADDAPLDDSAAAALFAQPSAARRQPQPKPQPKRKRADPPSVGKRKREPTGTRGAPPAEREEKLQKGGKQKDGKTRDIKGTTGKAKDNKAKDGKQKDYNKQKDGKQHSSATPGDQKLIGGKPGSRQRNQTVEDPERLARTIFVGNVPVEITRKQLSKHFAEYGMVQTVRIRSVASSNLKMPQKAAVITKGIDASIKPEQAHAATKSNGALAFGRHLRIDLATQAGGGKASKYIASRCVFLGNLPFDIQEETLWQHFESCGKIEYVRIVRDSRTQLGKGFGYIGFIEGGSVEAALAFHGTKFADRELRVFRYSGARGSSSAKADSQQAPQKADKGSGGGVGWQQRERNREMLKRQGKVSKSKSTPKKGMKGSVLKLKESAISKQRKLLKARKQVKHERKVKKRGGLLVKKSKKGKASRDL